MRATVVVSASEFDRGEVVIEGERYRHLFRARRASRKSEFRLTDGAGRECAARLDDVDSNSARLRVEGVPRRLEAPPWLGLVVPVLKPQRTAWMVEKATELGANEIRFYTGARAPRDLTRPARARLDRVAIAALAQSHGAWLPCLARPEPLATVVSKLPQDAARYAARQGAPRLDRCAVPCAWAIGTEGGWDPEEEELLRDVGFTAAGLADSVLRTETAALVGLSLARACALGD